MRSADGRGGPPLNVVRGAAVSEGTSEREGPAASEGTASEGAVGVTPREDHPEPEPHRLDTVATVDILRGDYASVDRLTIRVTF